MSAFYWYNMHAVLVFIMRFVVPVMYAMDFCEVDKSVLYSFSSSEGFFLQWRIFRECFELKFTSVTSALCLTMYVHCSYMLPSLKFEPSCKVIYLVTLFDIVMYMYIMLTFMFDSEHPCIDSLFYQGMQEIVWINIRYFECIQTCTKMFIIFVWFILMLPSITCGD